jgi:putative alpha-1,2-mannosidase
MPDVGYWAGNEPDILAPWLFVFGNCPHHTQYWTQWLVDHKYTSFPDGIPGNDDYGTMSAWLVFASLGFYPLSGAPFYILGSPSLQVPAVFTLACAAHVPSQSTSSCLFIVFDSCSVLRFRWSCWVQAMSQPHIP